MSNAAIDIWTDDTSVLFTSFYGWTPETWSCVNWSEEKGRSRRDNLLKELTDPFITVCYVTGNSSYFDPAAKGLITGFLLVSHEAGDRDKFTHPTHHDFEPAKWRHSLRAIRAFSYLPEHRLKAVDFMPELRLGGQAVATWGQVLDDRDQIVRLRDLPWRETPVYRPGTEYVAPDAPAEEPGYVQAGPAATVEYAVSPSTLALSRQLYVLRLKGDTNAYLGKPADGRLIYKVGLSRIPERRREAFQKSMPRGAFRWIVDRTSNEAGVPRSDFLFEAAVFGEDAIKRQLAKVAEHLGGEFYLATPDQMRDAWENGCKKALEYGGDN